MPDNKKKPSKTDNYNLKSDAVNRLANADKLHIPEDMKHKDPAKKYRSGFLDKIPPIVKTVFIKFWFYGAVCFFIFWGLAIQDSLDALVIMSVVLGLVSDIFIDNILRFIETVPGENARWMMFPKKRYWTFIANLIYAFPVFFCVRCIYLLFNTLGTGFGFYLGVEPIMFGIFYVLVDLLFVGMKNLFLTIINDAKKKVNDK